MGEAKGSGIPPSGKEGGQGRVRYLWLMVGAALLALGGYGCMRTKPRSAANPSSTQAEVAARAGAGQANVSQVAPMPNAVAESSDAGPDLKDYIPAGQNPGAGEVIARLRAAGINTGIAAFNPPGTSPPLIGIAVPEDFPLPEGFVRHAQATDDGQRIEPILMFSPDYDFFDEQGRPIQVPEDRVVPPEFAPPGLQIRMIRIPPPTDSAG